MCHFCGFPLPEGVRISRSSICQNCGKELRICLNCRFYQKGAHWDCHETIPEPVLDKERANFCDYFSPAYGRHGGKDGEKQKKARSDFDNLFGAG